MIAHPLVVIAEVGDAAAVRRGDGRIVRPGAAGQRRQAAGLDIQGEDFAVGGFALPVGATVGAEVEGARIGRPGQAAAVVEVAMRQLARAAALRPDDEDVAEAGFQIALTVGAVGDAVDDLQRRRPLGALGLGQRRADLGLFAGNQDGIGQLLAVGRPTDAGRGVGQVGDADRFTRRHPAHEQLRRAALGAGDVGQARTIWRPARLAMRTGRGDQGRMTAGLDVDQPDGGTHPVGHDVGRLADIGDLPAVRADLGVGGDLHAEQVLRGEQAAVGGRQAGRGGRLDGGLRHRGRMGAEDQGAGRPGELVHMKPPLVWRDHRKARGGGKIGKGPPERIRRPFFIRVPKKSQNLKLARSSSV